MSTKPLILALSCSFFIAALSHAQERRLRARILDINTHQPVAYANVFVKGTQIGTVSDFAGRFSLTVPPSDTAQTIVFQHINYDILEIGLDSLRFGQAVYLQPRVIPLPEIEIVAPRLGPEIRKDLPQTVAVLEARTFEIQGYVDAADLLRSDYSVQVEEELSGRKTVSLRGGNPDDVVVLYNGVRMNNQYDNVFDFSLVDLEDVRRVEVIKGSNTVLYGSEALSGIVNVVPRLEEDYTVRLQQRVGTYDSGNWGLHLYRSWKGLRGSYKYRRGAAKRRLKETLAGAGLLENRFAHHTANLEYRFGPGPGGIARNSLGLMVVSSATDFANNRDNESVSNATELVGLRYQGDIGPVYDLKLSLSRRTLDEEQSLSYHHAGVDRDIADKSVFLDVEKMFRFAGFDLLLGYQLQKTDLRFTDVRSGYGSQGGGRTTARLQRLRHGLATILKIHAPGGSKVVRTVDFDLSHRYDYVKDDLSGAGGLGWNLGTPYGGSRGESTFKFGAYASGYRRDYSFHLFVNIGSNIKFPTLAQIVGSRALPVWGALSGELKPESTHGLEIGFDLTRDISDHAPIDGWQALGSFIENRYTNKFRPIVTPGMPITLYDNVPEARISGFEGRCRVFFVRKKITVEAGISRYSISEKSAFPFKYDLKRTLDVMVDHAGYAFQFHWFKEGEQAGWVRDASGLLSEVILPSFSNVDLHMSKRFRLARLRFLANFSARNVLSRAVLLQGLALRDRRFYLTVGVEY